MEYSEVFMNNYKEETINILKFIKEKKIEKKKKINLKYIMSNIIILIILLLFFLLLRNFSIKKGIYTNSIKNNFSLYNETNKTKNYNIEYSSKLKGINFLNKCLENLNNNKTNSIFNIFNFKYNIFKKNPKISVIIPIYNCQNTIVLSLTSIQNQNNSDFEIILINDYSNDNSSIIINKLKNDDNRIKIINNKRNMGTLYSRCIGVLNAKGKYIFSLDNDDLFLDEDIFDSIVNIAEKESYDIVEFKAFTIPNYHPEFKDIQNNFFNFHPNNLILHQPELGLFPISRNNKFYPNDFSIWGKSIKTEIYKSAINALGEKRYSVYNCWTEDISVIFVIFNIANSYIFINKYGIFHIKSKNTNTYILKREHKIFAEIYLLDIIIEFLKENEKYKKYAVYKAYDLFNKIRYSSLSNTNKIFLKSILKKIMDCKYIVKNDKIQIVNKFRKFKIW